MRLSGQKLPLDRLSASSLSTYLTCPEQFRRKYLLREPEQMREERFIGSVAHVGIDKLFKATAEGAETGIADIIDEAWRETIERDGEPEWVKVDAPEAYGRLKTMLKAYWPIASATQPIAAERKFEETIDGVRFVGYIDLELIDRIREVKTTSQKQSKPKPRHSIQGRLYSLVSSKPVEWHYLTRQKTPQIYTSEECPSLLATFNSDATVAMLRRTIGQMADDYARYGKDDPWPMNGVMGDWTCGYCAYKHNCPAHLKAS